MVIDSPRSLSRRRTFLSIVAACLVIYHVNGATHAEVDCVAAPNTVWSILKKGSLDVSGYRDLDYLVGSPHLVDLPDGRRVSQRPLGSALVAVPLLAPVAAVLDDPPRASRMLRVGKLAGAICVAFAAGLIFLSVEVVAPSATWPTTVLFALGTCAWTVASQALWNHGPATLWVALGMYVLLKALLRRESSGGPTWFWIAGAAFGLAVLTRTSTVFLAFAAGISLVFVRNWRGAAWYLLGVVPFLAGLCLLNLHLFGHPIFGGYANHGAFSTPLRIGLTGLLVAPSRGLFVYTPALVLAPLGFCVICRDSRWANLRPFLSAQLAAVLVTTVFYARWYDWRGGWCFGPRFLIETLPVWCLLFGVAMERYSTPVFRRVALGLVGLSICVHLIGMAGHSEYAGWNKRHDSYADGGRSLFLLHDTQIGAHWQGVVKTVLGRQIRSE